MKEKVAAFIVCALALIPNDQFRIPFLANTGLWFYLVLVAGFLGFLFLYSKAHIILKTLLVYLFINCFLSKAPYLSFSAYLILILASGFYLLCLEVKKYDFIFKAIQSLFFLNIAIIVMQKFGFDKLLNFSLSPGQTTYWGTVGNPMILGSFIVCLTPFLILNHKHNIWPVTLTVWVSHSFGAILSVLAGFFAYLKGWKKALIIALVICSLIPAWSKVKNHYLYGRWPVWKRTVSLTTKNHPFVGYGIGTYKVIFPVMSRDIAGGVTNKWQYQGTEGNWLAWRAAHNCFLQILFETGYIGLGLLLGFIGWILYRIRDKRLLFSAAILLIVNMTWSFPSRMIQTVTLLIMFSAICQKEAINDKSI